MHVEVRKNSKTLHLQCFTAQSHLSFSFSLSASFWGSSVFLIPSQCSLSAPSHSLRKSGWYDGGLGKRRNGESMGLLTPVTSPPLFLSSSLCLTKSPLYLSASNVPTDSFVVNELSSVRWNFLNPHTQAHTGTHFPLTADLHFMSLTPHFLFTQPSAKFSFQDNHFISLLRFCHQGFCWWYEEVPKVLFFCLSCMRYWRWRESHDCKLTSNALSPNRVSSNSLSPLRDQKCDFSPIYVL